MLTPQRSPGDNKEATGDGGQIRPPPLSLPKGGGGIRGIGEKFAANPVTGTGSMTVPLATSPGRSGFGPSCRSPHDSGSGNGPFGFGWNLSFLPSLERRTRGCRNTGTRRSQTSMSSPGPKTWSRFSSRTAHDARTTRPPRYVIHRYRPRIEGLFARIERWTKVATGEIHWRSITRDNVTTLYGKDNNSRIVDPTDANSAYPQHVFSWLICKATTTRATPSSTSTPRRATTTSTAHSQRAQPRAHG